MSTAILCIFLAYLLPYGFVLAAKTGRGVNNAKPREYLENVQGWRRRAHWTQLNHYENFAPFAAAVIVCLQVGAAPERVDLLAIAFVIARLIYGFCYVFDFPAARTLVWLGAQACVVSLFIMAI